MAMFSAYFDASGHPDQHDVLTVAGYAASANSWTQFEKQWDDILKSESVRAFHMTDFASSGGEFVEWKGDSERRRTFTEKLAQCINENCQHLFRVSVVISDYRKVNQAFLLAETVGHPYTLCCLQIVFDLRTWANELGALNTLLYFFENGDKDKGDFETRHKGIYGNTPVFLDKSRTHAFEAADFAAWKMRTALHEANKSDHTPAVGQDLLRSMTILAGVRKEAGVLNAASLRTFCEMLSIPARV